MWVSQNESGAEDSTTSRGAHRTSTMVGALSRSPQIAGSVTFTQVTGLHSAGIGGAGDQRTSRVHRYCAHMSPSPGPDSARRVLAHPLRSRLVAHLRLHGQATASDLARALGTHTGATSYHLRRLAEVGLVIEGEPGRGRRRPWHAAAGATTASALARDPVGRSGEDEPEDADDAAAADWLARDYLTHFAQRAGTWLDTAPQWPPAWQSVCGLEDHAVLVSAEQLTALHEELVEVLARYRRVGQGNPAAKRVSVYTCAVPIDGPPRRSPD